jgi:heme exporter protein A
VKLALTVQENVADPAAIAQLGLAAYAALPARLLSAGQKRRLAIARVVAKGAPLWLLDEPTTGLDAASIDRFTEICATHRATGGIIIASTHTPLDLPGAEILRL